MTIDSIADNAQKAALQNGGHVPTLIAEGTKTTAALVFEAFAPTSDGRALRLYSAGIDLGKENPIGGPSGGHVYFRRLDVKRGRRETPEYSAFRGSQTYRGPGRIALGGQN